MKTIIEISLRQARDAEMAIRHNRLLESELVQLETNVWEYNPDLDLEFEEDREIYDDFIEELKMVLDLAYITEYEMRDVLEPNGVVICLDE